jgi:hypothetical protein
MVGFMGFLSMIGRRALKTWQVCPAAFFFKSRYFTKIHEEDTIG